MAASTTQTSAAPSPARLLTPAWSRLLIAASAGAVLLELGWLLGDWQLGWGPTMPVLPAVVTVPFLLVAARRALPRLELEAWRLFAAVTALAAAVVVAVTVPQAGWAVTVELAAASFAEEVIYRVAVPVFLAALVRAAGFSDRQAMAAGIVGAVVGFTVLPGHLTQVASGGPLLLVAFAGMAALWSLAVWTSGAVWPAAITHAVLNTSILPVEAGQWSAGVRVGITAVLLLALLHGTHRQQVAAAAA